MVNEVFYLLAIICWQLFAGNFLLAIICWQREFVAGREENESIKAAIASNRGSGAADVDESRCSSQETRAPPGVGGHPAWCPSREKLFGLE